MEAGWRIAANGAVRAWEVFLSRVQVGGIVMSNVRAAVLEEIVHKEIAAIERAFGGNEERIRNLVAGIENQRSALHQATLLISNDTNPLITRLENNTKNLDGIMMTAQDTLGRLEGGLREVSGSIVRAVDDMTDRAAAAGNDMSMQTAHMEDVSTQMLGQLRDAVVKALSNTAQCMLSKAEPSYGDAIRAATEVRTQPQAPNDV